MNRSSKTIWQDTFIKTKLIKFLEKLEFLEIVCKNVYKECQSIAKETKEKIHSLQNDAMLNRVRSASLKQN